MANGKVTRMRPKQPSSEESHEEAEESARYWQEQAKEARRHLGRQVNKLTEENLGLAAENASLKMSRRAWKRKAYSLSYAIRDYASGERMPRDLESLLDLTAPS